MATRGSEKTTNTGGTPVQCMSPALTSGLWVTNINAGSVAHGSGSMFIFNHSITSGTTQSYSEVNFRAYGDGRLTNFWEQGGSVIGSTYLSDVDVKRPNCACTKLTEFTSSYLHEGFVYFITFEDGYTLRAGPSMSVLVPGSGLHPKTIEDLQVGDLVCKCGNTGRTNEVFSDCVTVTKKQTHGLFNNTLTGSITHNITTTWPQDNEKFASSECRACFMVENGVYVLAIPNGGSY